jgi:MerR family transcriptional regulator, copper efflux regulator
VDRELNRHLPIAAKSGIALPGGDVAREHAPESPAAEERLLQVGDIAKACGKTVRAIHHYEEMGLLRPSARSKGRFRLYDHGAIARIRWIGKLHDLGLSLPQIQDVVRTWESASSAPEAMSTMRAVYRARLDQTRTQIEHLRTLERELESSLEYLETCDTCDPAELVAACCNCNVHDADQPEPELVAGVHGKRRTQQGRVAPETAPACQAKAPVQAGTSPRSIAAADSEAGALTARAHVHIAGNSPAPREER